MRLERKLERVGPHPQAAARRWPQPPLQVSIRAATFLFDGLATACARAAALESAPSRPSETKANPAMQTISTPMTATSGRPTFGFRGQRRPATAIIPRLPRSTPLG